MSPVRHADTTRNPIRGRADRDEPPRTAIALAVAGALAACSPVTPPAPPPPPETPAPTRAEPIVTRDAAATPRGCGEAFPHHGAADLHVDLPYQSFFKQRAIDLTAAESQVTADGLRAGCVGLVVLSLYLPSGFRTPRHTCDQLVALLVHGEELVASNPTLFAAPDGITTVFGVEGAHALAGHEDALPALIARRVVLFGLVHSLHNALADSATDRRKGRGGLTDSGTRFTRAVYRAGGLVDVSHSSDEAFWDVAAIATEWQAPLVATHSNARAVSRHRRNLTDDQLRAIARSGGLAGVDFHSPHLRRDGRRADIADVVRHITHMIAIMGADHVAIGSDLDGNIQAALGLESHAGLQTLARALRDAGVPQDAIHAVLGDNAWRILRPRIARAGRAPGSNARAPRPPSLTSECE